MALKFKVRFSDGKQKMITDVKSTETLKDLMIKIGNLVDKSWKCIQIKYGFPPKIINDDINKSLSELNIKSGNLIITYIKPELNTIIKDKMETKTEDISDNIESKNSDNKTDTNNNNNNTSNNISSSKNDGTILLKKIDDDNSCLFNAISFCCDNMETGSDKVEELREIISGIVLSSPDIYNEGILGKKPDLYCEYIMGKNTWGGDIEISILSKYYNIQINVFDITNSNPNIINYNNDNNDINDCIYLIYAGIHYDSIYMKNSDNSIQTKFNKHDNKVFAMVYSLAMDLHDKGKFTNVYKFTLKCGICNAKLVGQNDAQKHAQLTGHTQFAEYK